MSKNWRLTGLITASTVLTILLVVQYLLIVWLPEEMVPVWVMTPTLLFTLLIAWVYVLLNIFNCIWREKSDVMLELIHGFSVIGLLWSWNDLWQWFPILQPVDLSMKIDSLLFILVVTLTVIRTALYVKSNRASTIVRWIGMLGTSLFAGLNLVSAFIEVDPYDRLFSGLWTTSLLLAFAGIIGGIVLYYLPVGKKRT